MLTNNLDSGSEGELDIICNVEYVLPREYVTVTEVTKKEEEYLVEEATSH